MPKFMYLDIFHVVTVYCLKKIGIDLRLVAVYDINIRPLLYISHNIFIARPSFKNQRDTCSKTCNLDF